MYLVALMVFSGTTFLVSGQPNPECNFQQDMIPGNMYYIYSPGYGTGNPYPANLYCRWFARAPSSYKINITCNINLPYSASCPPTKDRLLVSLTGDTNNFHRYCGSGTFSMQSEGNNLLVELHVPKYTPGGNFSCSLTAPSKPTPPPPICECGKKKESRIVNGVETGINEYPMMAAIIDIEIRDLICGCTIISPRYVLTAAHCLVNRLPKNVGILIGDHDISNASETNSTKLLRAEHFIGHPNYNTNTQVNDIALIRVVDFISFTNEVGPVCLPFRYPDLPHVGDVVTVLGWGTVEHAGPKSDVLMKANLDVVDIATCKHTFGNDTVSENQICTFRRGTDACQADSGGPVIYDGERVWLEGVISYGKGCAIQYPGINTRVGKYLQWILQSTPGKL